MNLGIELLPSHCDVLVVGAGPAGSAARHHAGARRPRRGAGRPARLPARQGLRRRPDPRRAPRAAPPRRARRGDGAGAARATHVGCIGPRGGRVDVPGTLAVLPRTRARRDRLPRRRARRRAHASRRCASTRRSRTTARSSARGCSTARPRARSAARWVVLATGAVPQALIAAGMCERRTPSGVALRGYVKNDAMVGRIDELEVVWHRALRAGLRLDLPVPRRRVQHRRGHRRQPHRAPQRQARRSATSTCARCSTPSRASTRRRAS